MSVKVRIPSPLRGLTNDLDVVAAEGGTLAACIAGLDSAYPGIKDRICDETGEIRRFVNVFVNGDNVRDGAGEATALKPGDEVGIIPAMAGGDE
jgi:molybdopterin synthase sulfur carrier subunit